jgi:hypothetical protein
VTAYAERFPDAEILITGVEDPDARAHGANESLHLATFERACLAEALFLHSLAPVSAENLIRATRPGDIRESCR